MNLKETEFEDVDWIQLSPVGGFCKHGDEPSESVKGGVFLPQLSAY
jgi:hypothetical protein